MFHQRSSIYRTRVDNCKSYNFIICMGAMFQVPLTRRQCLLLISAGSLSHFFLDHLFEVILSEI